MVVGVGVATAGCGRYSIGALKAQKAYKEANDLYRAPTGRRPPRSTNTCSQKDPPASEVYFFLGNSYDNAYKPSRAGEPENDAYIQKAIENYRKAAEHDQNPEMKKLALQYLVAAYGPEKLNDPSQAEPIVQKMISAGSERAGQLLRAVEDLRGRRPLRGGRSGADEGPRGEAERSQRLHARSPASTTARASSTRRWKRCTRRPSSSRTNPQGHQLVAAYYWEKANKDHRLTQRPEDRNTSMKGIEAADKALALNPDYSEALTYKNILLRMQANTETDRGEAAGVPDARRPTSSATRPSS